MKRKEMIAEGKSKILYTTDDADKVIVYFKDDATAGDGLKRGTIQGKGAINCRFSTIIFELLEKQGIPTHFLEQVSDVEMLCKKVDILMVEVIVRNLIAGSMAKRMGMEEGTDLGKTILEHDYKCDELHDPIVNLWHIKAMDLATEEQYDKMNELTVKVNDFLVPFFDERGIILVDYKLEYGINNGQLILADEITPDGCRLWDKQTKKKLDKDRFRRDMDGIEDAYEEVLGRIQ